VRRAEEELDLQFALDRLPLKERDALRLRLNGWTNREIAAAENSSETAIRQRVSRAVVKARAILRVKPPGGEY
jgi:DNA-directed RNA polymerase specialized sigma24 family protein